nr:MAG TPA: hypothetical protein [Caudoviricetes sp.]
MITAEDIEKYLVEGHVEYIKRVTLVFPPYNKGYYIGTSAHIQDFFIRDVGTTPNAFHSGSKVLKHHHPWVSRIIYVLPQHVEFESLGLKV